MDLDHRTTEPASTVVGHPAAENDAPIRPKTARNAEWCRLYEEGKTSCEIADLYGVSRERVCQILRKENLIAHKEQRQRLAAELVEQDKILVRAARYKREQELLTHVRAGDSIATAAGKVGITTTVATLICKKHGVESQWGRWRDYAQRKARLKELVERDGLSLNAAMEKAGSEEGKTIGYLWVQHNCPEILKKNRKVAAPPQETVTPIPRMTRAAARPALFPEFEWTEERINRLLDLWFGGVSAQQIADIFANCSRNAILGQIHRLRVGGKLKRPELPDRTASDAQKVGG